MEEASARDQFTIMLGVEQASGLDQGSFTCQVEDGGYQHCLSTVVEVMRHPEIQIDPMSLTVEKVGLLPLRTLPVTNDSI